MGRSSEIKSQCVIWLISTVIILSLFPWLVLLWIWNGIANFKADTLKRARNRPDPSKLAPIYGGTSRFVQLKVRFDSYQYFLPD